MDDKYNILLGLDPSKIASFFMSPNFHMILTTNQEITLIHDIKDLNFKYLLLSDKRSKNWIKF
jgi:hypothetical protein